MTPVLCLNCGKAYVEHICDDRPTYCHGYDTDQSTYEMEWRSPIDESAIEQRVVEAIATWVSQGDWICDGADIAELIRSGAWHPGDKP